MEVKRRRGAAGSHRPARAPGRRFPQERGPAGRHGRRARAGARGGPGTALGGDSAGPDGGGCSARPASARGPRPPAPSGCARGAARLRAPRRPGPAAAAASASGRAGPVRARRPRPEGQGKGSEAKGRGRGRGRHHGGKMVGGGRAARTHPGRPVRVALHLGKHQVPGLEGVRHAGGGKPRPRGAAAAAAAAASGEAGGGSRERRGRRRSLGQRAGASLLGCALWPDVPPSCRHRRETRSLRTTCRDRGARGPMRRGAWRTH